MKAINTSAPVQSTQSIRIQAGSEKIWKLLSDIPHWNSWMKSVTHTKLNGPLQPGTSFDWKNGSSKIHSVLHTVEPFSALGWTGKVYGVYAIHNWTFKEENGITEVAVSESMEGFLARLFKSPFNKMLDKDMRNSLELLKTACEK